MSFAKSPLRRRRIGRAGHTRFVEVEIPAVPAPGERPLVIELEVYGRILLSDPAHVGLAAQLLATIAGSREGGHP